MLWMKRLRKLLNAEKERDELVEANVALRLRLSQARDALDLTRDVDKARGVLLAQLISAWGRGRYEAHRLPMSFEYCVVGDLPDLMREPALTMLAQLYTLRVTDTLDIMESRGPMVDLRLSQAQRLHDLLEEKMEGAFRTRFFLIPTRAFCEFLHQVTEATSQHA